MSPESVRGACGGLLGLDGAIVVQFVAFGHDSVPSDSPITREQAADLFQRLVVVDLGLPIPLVYSGHEVITSFERMGATNLTPSSAA
jgi:hypothetical protein